MSAAAASASSPAKTRSNDHLEACLSAERKKRQRAGDGPLPDIPGISLTPMFGNDAAAKAAVAQHCAAQLAAALEFSVADPEYGDKPASLIRKMAAETQTLLA